MCLEVKNGKAKNDRFICTLKCSKNVQVRSLLEAQIKKVRIDYKFLITKKGVQLMIFQAKLYQ